MASSTLPSRRKATSLLLPSHTEDLLRPLRPILVELCGITAPGIALVFVTIPVLPARGACGSVSPAHTHRPTRLGRHPANVWLRFPIQTANRWDKNLPAPPPPGLRACSHTRYRCADLR